MKKSIEVRSSDNVVMLEHLMNCKCNLNAVFLECLRKIKIKKCFSSGCFVNALFTEAIFGPEIKWTLNKNRKMPRSSDPSTWIKVIPTKIKGFVNNFLHPNIRKKYRKIFMDQNIKYVNMTVVDLRFVEPNIRQIMQKLRKVKKVPLKILKNGCVKRHRICSLWKIDNNQQIVTHHNKLRDPIVLPQVGEIDVREYNVNNIKLTKEQVKDMYITINFSFKKIK